MAVQPIVLVVVVMGGRAGHPRLVTAHPRRLEPRPNSSNGSSLQTPRPRLRAMHPRLLLSDPATQPLAPQAELLDGTAMHRNRLLRVIRGACHNIHIQKAPVPHHGAIGLFPQGNHLAEALGDDYVAIAVTSARGGTARMRMKPEHPLGFEVDDHPLRPVVDASIEAAFTTKASLTIADLRTARADVDDAGAFQRMRMEDYFKDVPVLQAFDAIACIAETTPDRGTRIHKRDAIVGTAQAQRPANASFGRHR